MEFDEYQAMNTTIQVAAEGSRDELLPGFELVRRFTAECEERFSRFRDNSELCQLNRSAGTWFHSSTEMMDLVGEALDLYHLTGGLFDPSILNALQRSGYDRSMDEIKEIGHLLEAVAALPFASHFGQTRLDITNEAILIPSDAQIDLGGIAKGWIAENAARLLADYTPACAVSIGGDLFFHGTPQGETAWQVSLEDPLDEQNVLAILSVGPGALATSTVTRRKWLQGNQERHHIIDPRTGIPADSEWLSVSVATPKATAAEAFAKAILIGGSQVAAQFTAQYPDSWFIVVQPDGSLSGSNKSKEFLYEPV